MKSDDLSSIIDFLYCGEANVYQDNLDSFLAIAEELKLKGLMGQNNGGNEKEENVYTTQPMPVNPASYVKEEQTRAKSTKCGEQPLNTRNSDERKIVNPDYPLVSTFGGLQELDQQVKSMMKQSQNRTQDGTRWAFICQVCGKEGHNSAIRNHIEANHLEGVSLPCSLCERVFRSRHNLKRHNCENRTQASPIYSGLGMPWTSTLVWSTVIDNLHNSVVLYCCPIASSEMKTFKAGVNKLAKLLTKKLWALFSLTFSLNWTIPRKWYLAFFVIKFFWTPELLGRCVSCCSWEEWRFVRRGTRKEEPGRASAFRLQYCSLLLCSTCYWKFHCSWGTWLVDAQPTRSHKRTQNIQAPSTKYILILRTLRTCLYWFISMLTECFDFVVCLNS